MRQTTVLRPPVEAVDHHGKTRAVATPEFEADVRVEAKVVVAESIVAVSLREVTNRPLPRWEPGAHVDLVLDQAPGRQYSLCGDPQDPYLWRLGILRDPDSSGGSRYVHDVMQVGDVVQVRGPRNNFRLAASPRYLFIAGGIGITPILPMVVAATAAGAEWKLVYGGKERAAMAFLQELADHGGDRVSVQPQDEVGQLDVQALMGTPRPDTLVYCCGPEGLLNAVEQRCTEWPRGSVHVERFSAKPLTEPVLPGSFEVYLSQSQITLTVGPEECILDRVEQAGIGVSSSCAEGICGTCETTVLEGVPDHRDFVLDDDEKEANDCMMICVSRACTPRLVLKL